MSACPREAFIGVEAYPGRTPVRLGTMLPVRERPSSFVGCSRMQSENQSLSCMASGVSGCTYQSSEEGKGTGTNTDSNTNLGSV